MLPTVGEDSFAVYEDNPAGYGNAPPATMMTLPAARVSLSTTSIIILPTRETALKSLA
jgi:hypothetical protein